MIIPVKQPGKINEKNNRIVSSMKKVIKISASPNLDRFAILPIILQGFLPGFGDNRY